MIAKNWLRPLTAMALVGALAGCDEGLTEINENPNSPEIVPVGVKAPVFRSNVPYSNVVLLMPQRVVAVASNRAGAGALARAEGSGVPTAVFA